MSIRDGANGAEEFAVVLGAPVKRLEPRHDGATRDGMRRASASRASECAVARGYVTWGRKRLAKHEIISFKDGFSAGAETQEMGERRRMSPS
jgi:hypothetical protein